MAGFSKPRVHFINRFFYPDLSATSQILQGIAFGLAERGYDVHVTTSRQLYENSSAALPANERVGGVTIHRMATSRFGRSSSIGRAIDYVTFHAAAAQHLLRNVAPGDVVVAKTDPPLISVVAAHAARRRGAVLVNWLQDLFPEIATAADLGGPLTRRPLSALRRLRDWSLHRAWKNVVIGDRMEAFLLHMGVPQSKISLIPNWADPDIIDPISESPLRESWGLTGKFVVGYSGNLGRVHEMATLIGAIEAIGQQRDDPVAASIEFVFVGGGAMRGVLERQVSARALANVRFVPYQPTARLADALGVPDVHLVSLKPEFEGLVVPSKIYGIMAAARPSIFIGAADGEVARLLRQHACGTVISAGDPQALAGAILSFARNSEKCSAMGAAARAAFEASYTKLASVRRWDELLSEFATPAHALPTERFARN